MPEATFAFHSMGSVCVCVCGQLSIPWDQVFSCGLNLIKDGFLSHTRSTVFLSFGRVDSEPPKTFILMTANLNVVLVDDVNLSFPLIKAVLTSKDRRHREDGQRARETEKERHTAH